MNRYLQFVLPRRLAPALVLGLLAVAPATAGQGEAPASQLGSADSATVAVAAPATVRTTSVQTVLALPAEWNVKSKGQLKIRKPRRVSCSTSTWKSRRLSGRRVYVAVSLMCKVPADGATRTVVLYNKKRKSQAIYVPVSSGTPATDRTPAPVTTPVQPTPPRAPGRADDFTYMGTQPGNSAAPITWDRCTPIDVAVNLGPAPADELGLVVAAIEQTAAASGLPLRYAGPTNYVPTSPSPGPYPDGVEIVFALTTPARSAFLDGELAGWGGLSYSGTGYSWAVDGQVVIDWNVTGPMTGGPEGMRVGAYMHELGHSVGMGHAAEEVQVMFPYISAANTPGWGAGDRGGLASLGAQPCRAG